MATIIVNNFISPRTPFEMVIKTDNLSTGSTADNQFKIPHYSTGTYNYKVDWGDGTIETIRGNTSPTHTYPGIGTYNVKIWGVFEGVYFNNTGDRLKLINIGSIDRRGIRQRYFNSYYGCNNLQSFPDIDTSREVTFNNCWSGCSELSVFPLIDTSNAVTLSSAWLDCSSLTSFPAINTSKVTNFNAAWRNCTGLSDFPLMDVSSASSFFTTWTICTALQNFPSNFFDGWSGVPSSNALRGTWDECWALTAQSVENILVSIDVSGQSALGITLNIGNERDITIDYNVATGALSSATNTAIANLKVKGWKPHINNVYV